MKEQTLHIKNMVCGRCKAMVSQIFKKANIEVLSIELGEIILATDDLEDLSIIGTELKQIGFEIIRDDADILIEKVKISLIKKIDEQVVNGLSEYLSREFSRSYSTLSKIFSKTEGITLEKYLINLKIEKVKELIQLGQLSFTEIAYSLNYKSSSHLARQFKTETGMSMSKYKSLQKWDRRTLDRIV